jgi:hypothetical protein
LRKRGGQLAAECKKADFLAIEEAVHQKIKPNIYFVALTARLKPCHSKQQSFAARKPLQLPSRTGCIPAPKSTGEVTLGSFFCLPFALLGRYM